MIFRTGRWWLFVLYISIGDLMGKVPLDMTEMMRHIKQFVEYIFKPLEILTHSPDKTHQKTQKKIPYFFWSR